MSDDHQVSAELEYQRLLSELHAARAHLAELEAAQRRLEIDRSRMGPAEAAASHAGLLAELTQARATTKLCHDEAENARARLNRSLTPSEPNEMALDLPFEGFEQPHFEGPQ